MHESFVAKIGCSVCIQMAKGNVGSLLVFDPSKIDFANEEQVKSAAGDAVVGIVTERGLTENVAITSVVQSDNSTHASSLSSVTQQTWSKNCVVKASTSCCCLFF